MKCEVCGHRFQQYQDSNNLMIIPNQVREVCPNCKTKYQYRDSIMLYVFVVISSLVIGVMYYWFLENENSRFIMVIYLGLMSLFSVQRWFRKRLLYTELIVISKDGVINNE